MRPSRDLPRYVFALGIALGIGALVEVAAATLAFPPDAVMFPRVLTSLPFVLGLLYGGYRLSEDEIPPDRHPRIWRWCLGGLAVFLLVNAAIMLAVPPVNTLILFGWVRWAITLGASVGLLIGSFEARAIHREVVAERARVSFERERSRRDLLDYVDTLLARDVVPRSNAIADRAERLLDADSGPSATDDVAAIRRDARTMRSLLSHAKHLLDPDGDTRGLEAINLAATLTDDVARPQSAAGSTVDCDVSSDDEWYVLADGMLPETFEHLVAYLAARADSETPTVSVTVEPGPETVTVRFDCGDATVPERERDALFEYAGGDDPSLPLVGVLLDYYGAAAEITETGPDGTVVSVTLDRVAVEATEGAPIADDRRRVAG